jgi:hypothetical protein
MKQIDSVAVRSALGPIADQSTVEMAASLGGQPKVLINAATTL